ncbi:N-acetyltransferase [Spirillospora sp. NBC_01491]|uniref:N-acetyltransferase n=1 Tax=Spirillospora sp. NBC_01491 TaxID=2976007 RepID=UPI002E347D42|nr:N-acetyltransferase [Spirillospora sp. NBC_01491]
MDVVITTLAERPELAGPLRRMPAGWPEFVQHDPVNRDLFALLATTFPEFTLVATDPGGQVAARAHSVPFALAAPGRATLPDGGWAQVMTWAFADELGAAPARGEAAGPDAAGLAAAADTVSAIEVAVRPDLRGAGLSGAMLRAMRENAAPRGLVAPVRPTGKHLEPATPMAEYAFRTRGDGLPADPWLRTHVRAGGVIESIAPASMTVAGSLARWRSWTGLPFDADGWVEVPGALVPVRCAVAHDHAVYVEPNVWIRHPAG